MPWPWLRPSCWPRGAVPWIAPDIVNIDKVVHFSIFGLLATLVARAGFNGQRGWWAVLIVSLFGMTDEWHQSFTPGRAVEIADWVADTLGAITAVGLYIYWRWYRVWLEKPLGGRVSQCKSWHIDHEWRRSRSRGYEPQMYQGNV